MSLVGFKAQNHTQQVATRAALDEVDDRGTHPENFDPLHERFRFTLDVAAAPHNAKCDRFYTREDDGLAQSWADERVWCNPPWWQELVEPYRDQGGALSVEFLPGRMRFIRPNAVIGPKGDRPPFGCCLLIWERR